MPDEEKPTLVSTKLAGKTPREQAEALAEMYFKLTGRRMTPEEIAEGERELAEAEA